MLLLPAGVRAQVPGCTDPLAGNYNPTATQNDGSCTYPATGVTATTLAQLPDTIEESSGLLFWNGTFWTHNDDTDTTLYAIDTANGHIIARVAIAGAPNHDWEELAQDDDYIYIGDFGNNGDGNRQDLAILRVPKPALLHGQTVITPDKIFFSYADQTNFSPTGNNNTDFDCEAFIATSDSLYLFTKQWLSGKTKLYALPKTPGTYVASPQAEYNVDGLITGATYLPAKRTVVLSGYKIAGFSFDPLMLLLYDYFGSRFFSGNKRRITLGPTSQFHQIEGIASTDGRQFFLTNEKLSQIIVIPAKLLKVDMTTYLSTWYGSLGIPAIALTADTVLFYPNPAGHEFSTVLRSERAGSLKAELYNEAGRLVASFTYTLKPGENHIPVQLNASASPGNYFVKLAWSGRLAWGRISLY